MRIILACAAGMSTSVLASHMQQAAKTRGIEVTVEAMSTSSLDEAQWQSADVVLVGPQMRHQLSLIAQKGAEYQVPVEVIQAQDYAMANGQKVLEQALTLARSEQDN